MHGIESYIKLLLYTQECVIIPDFGGFVTQHKPAYLDKKTHIIYPPSKHVGFNRKLRGNDGLLAHEICMQEGIGFPEAMQRVKQWVNDCHECIQRTKRLEISGLGVFYLEAERIQFRTENRNGFLDSSFGLVPVHLTPALQKAVPIQEEQKVVEQVAQSESNHVTTVIPIHGKSEVIEEKGKTEPTIKEKPTRRRTALRILAAASVAIPIGFYAYWIPVQTDVLKTGKISLADLNPFSSTQETSGGKYQQRNQELNLISDFKKEEIAVQNGYAEIDLGDNQTIAIAVTPIKTPESTLNKGPFYAVTGCFSNKSNAERFLLEQLEKGLNATQIDVHGGLTRVGLGGFATASEARQAVANAQAAGYQAWILKK